jgi:hypothetical protein
MMIDVVKDVFHKKTKKQKKNKKHVRRTPGPGRAGRRLGADMPGASP